MCTASLILGGLIETLGAQTWSAPFNHNEVYNGNGNYTHPYSPWHGLNGVGAQPAASSWAPGSSAGAIGNVIYPATPPHLPFVFVPGYEWPQADGSGRSFEAVHMSVIPKGPYRGMVLVWDIRQVLATVNPPIPGLPVLTAPVVAPPAATKYYGQSYQAVSVIDPTDSATGPLGGIRYRNFLVPVGTELEVQQPFPPPPFLNGKNFFCAGHTWTRYGDLVVGGGTDFWENGGIEYRGGRLTYIWNPRELCFWPNDTVLYYPNLGFPYHYNGMWVRGPDLEFPRWYPTALATHEVARQTAEAGPAGARQRILLFGGWETVPPPAASAVLQARNSYEALVVDGEAVMLQSRLRIDSVTGSPSNIRTWFGPSNTPSLLEVEWLDDYPRVHLLSSGEIFFSGYAPRWGLLNPEMPGAVWPQAPGQVGQPAGTYSSNWNLGRHDGASVLFPNFGGNADIVVRLGGADGFLGPTTDTMESIATASSSEWEPQRSMLPTDNLQDGGRTNMNVVILPTGALLVLGGVRQYLHGGVYQEPVYSPLLFEEGKWYPLPPNPTPSRRTYHSTAVLLPDGRVFLGGGDDRDFDYEIFSPEYMSSPQNRPQGLVWQVPVPVLDPTFDADTLDYGSRYVIEHVALPLGHTVTKVVLTAPCSTTDHSDMHQRYVELDTEVQDGTTVVMYTPTNKAAAPPGIYMLWLVTNAGSVSEAKWVVLP